MNHDDIKPWEVLSRFVEIKSPWMTLIGERLRDDADKELEYWRVEKDDSLVVLVVQGDKLLLPKPMYRPGVQRATLDFCGGRITKDANTSAAALKIIEREFKLDHASATNIAPINAQPWDINSSFENQRLIGYAVTLDSNIAIDESNLGGAYDLSEEGVQQLLADLVCLQCRALLLEWLRNRQ